MWIKPGVLLERRLEPLVDRLKHMRRKFTRIVIQHFANQRTKRQFDFLDPTVQFTKVGRKIQPLLYQEALYGFLDRALAFRKKSVVVRLGERIS